MKFLTNSPLRVLNGPHGIYDTENEISKKAPRFKQSIQFDCFILEGNNNGTIPTIANYKIFENVSDLSNPVIFYLIL